MSPRRAARPRRRRVGTASTDAVQRTSRQELAADAAHEGLAVTHWFDPGRDGGPYPVTVTFRGTRDGIAGKRQPGDTFTKVERIPRVVPGSGPISVSTWAYGLNPGTWTITAELVRERQSTGLRSGQTLPRARWSWLRWRLAEAPFEPVHTRTSLLVRLGSIPAVVPGSWSALVGLGIVLGIAVLLWLLGFEGIDAGRALLVAVIGTAGGLVGGKLWYMVIRPRSWRASMAEGWSIDGSIAGAIVAAVATVLLLGLPVGAFLDAGAAALALGASGAS